MAFLYNKLIRKILLLLILIWSTVFFWLINPLFLAKISIVVLALICLILIILEESAIFILISLSFLVSYAFYGLLFQFALPIWLVMLSLLIIFGYLFTYTEQRIGILGNKRLVYLVLFSLVILEVFLTLSYFLINPLSQSLIISAISYLFVGFCYTVLAKHTDNKFSTYITLTILAVLTILATSHWGIL